MRSSTPRFEHRPLKGSASNDVHQVLKKEQKATKSASQNPFAHATALRQQMMALAN